MTFEDWRNAPDADLAPCYAEEVRRWDRGLQWDFSRSAAELERGRRLGRVGGYLVRDGHGAVRGWSYFVVNQRTLQIGAINAQTVEQLRGLLDCILRSPEAEAAQDITCFAYPHTPGLVSALERRRFTIVGFSYMSAPVDRLLEAVRGETVTLLPWMSVEGPAVVRLLARSYAGEPVARWFAPHGRLDEWAHYVGQLVHSSGCGTFLPDASFGATSCDLGLVGAALTTRLSNSMTHIAQLAVDPATRRQGVARQLVAAAARASRTAGYDSCSLLVAEDNEPARRLYARLGFEATNRFISARRAPLRRPLAIERPLRAPTDAGAKAS